MDLSFNLAPSYRDLKDPTSRQNFEDTVEQKRVIDLRACLKSESGLHFDCNSLNEVPAELVSQSFIMSNVLHRADLSTQILPQKTP